MKKLQLDEHFIKWLDNHILMQFNEYMKIRCKAIQDAVGKL